MCTRDDGGGPSDVLAAASAAKEASPAAPAAVLGHGSRALPAVTVDTYNEELRDEEGFVGDRASGRAFRAILDDWRERVSASLDEDPFGDTPTNEISKSKLDKLLGGADPVAAVWFIRRSRSSPRNGHGGAPLPAPRRLAGNREDRHRRRLEFEPLRPTGHGAGAGDLAAENISIELRQIANHPDEAGLIGAVQLAPSWVLAGHDAIIAVDIGGTNMRAGIVELRMKKGDVSKAAVWKKQHWRHRDDEPTRDEAVARLAEMVSALIDKALAEKIRLAPFMGIGCPGLIDDRGAIVNGGQNLPGNWQEDGFNLVTALSGRLPRIEGHEPAIVVHNDAVVQGLSEVPNMRDVSRWGVLTIGTGLGNARFSKRAGD